VAGGSVVTTLGRDKISQLIGDNIAYFKIGEGGFNLSGLATEIIDAASPGWINIYDYTITGGDFVITDVNVGTKKFEVAGKKAGYFPDGTQIRVEGSTGNDGVYTVAGTTEFVDTLIEVEEVIPSGVVDGIIYADHLPIALGPVSDATHYPLRVEELTPGDVLVQHVEDTTGIGDLTGSGASEGTVNYKSGALHVEFENDVAVGNKVVVKFKYHDTRKAAVSGEGYDKLMADDSPIAPDGDPELYSYKKLVEPGDIVFRGVGWGTVRCTMTLAAGEAIDDGRGASYGGIPYYFEMGIFDSDDVLLAYMTFDKERKTGAVTITHTIDVVV
jgi:hypothetical protein